MTNDKLRELVNELASVCEMIGYATSGNERASHRTEQDKIKTQIFAAMQGEDVVRDAARYQHCVKVGRFPTLCQDGKTWMAWKTTSPTSSVSGKSPSEAIDAAMGERHG